MRCRALVVMVAGVLACAPVSVAQPSMEWVSLFDGQAISHWRGFRMTGVPEGWRVEEGAITWTGQGAPADLVSREQYADFELEFDWRLPPGGNSGVMFRVTEALDRTYLSGPEYQLLDNARHADGKDPLTTAASNYAMHAPARDATRPVGEWNTGRLVVNGEHVEHWLNGEQVVEYTLHSPDWTQRMLASKFRDWPRYGREPRGHIALQEHGARVQFRNLRLRTLPGRSLARATVHQPASSRSRPVTQP